MQPTSQLPTDAPDSPAPKNLKRNALLLLLAVAIVAALVAWLLPRKQVEASRQPPTTSQGTPSAQRAQTDAYKAPATR